MRAAIKRQMKLFGARKFLLYFFNELRGVLKFFHIGLHINLSFGKAASRSQKSPLPSAASRGAPSCSRDDAGDPGSGRALLCRQYRARPATSDWRNRDRLLSDVVASSLKGTNTLLRCDARPNAHVRPRWLESRVNMKWDESIFARRCHAGWGRRMR